MPDNLGKRDLIGVVGPCSAGKTTLISKLQNIGYQCRHIAQEHSYVRDMWQRIVDPQILIFLDVSYEISMKRKQLNMNSREFDEQLARLEHARQYANIYIQTDQLTPGEVFEMILSRLEDYGIQSSE